MKNITIKRLDHESIKELVDSEESLCIVVDSDGVPKDMISLLDNLLSEREDFKIDISTDKNDSKDYISGIDIIPSIANVKHIRVQATLRQPLDDLSIFGKIIDLRKIELYGNLSKGIVLSPLDIFDKLELIQIENGLTLRQQTFLESRKDLLHLDVAYFNALSFDKNKSIKTLKVNIKLTGLESLSRALPELESIFLEQRNLSGNLASLGDMANLKSIFIKHLESITAFPDLSKLKTLRRLELNDMPKLTDISSISLLENLETLILHDMENINIKELKLLKELKKLKNVNISFKNTYKEKESRVILKGLGIEV